MCSQSPNNMTRSSNVAIRQRKQGFSLKSKLGHAYREIYKQNFYMVYFFHTRNVHECHIFLVAIISIAITYIVIQTESFDSDIGTFYNFYISILCTYRGSVYIYTLYIGVVTHTACEGHGLNCSSWSPFSTM